MSELALDSDTYEPCMDSDNNYVDYCPPSAKFKNGLRCLCGARQNHVFNNRSCFQTHLKTEKHREWLAKLNANKMNYYIECQRLKEVINSQQKMIKKLEDEKNTNILTINNLAQQIMIKDREIYGLKNCDEDLINFMD